MKMKGLLGRRILQKTVNGRHTNQLLAFILDVKLPPSAAFENPQET